MNPDGILAKMLPLPDGEQFRELADIPQIAEATVRDWVEFSEDIITEISVRHPRLWLPAVRFKVFIKNNTFTTRVWLNGNYFKPVARVQHCLDATVAMLIDALQYDIVHRLAEGSLETPRLAAMFPDLSTPTVLVPHWFDAAALKHVKVLVEGHSVFVHQPSQPADRLLLAVVEWDRPDTRSLEPAFDVTPVPPANVLLLAGASQFTRYDDPFLRTTARFVDVKRSVSTYDLHHTGEVLTALGYIVRQPPGFLDPTFPHKLDMKTE